MRDANFLASSDRANTASRRRTTRNESAVHYFNARDGTIVVRPANRYVPPDVKLLS
jgi:hypothetical protein